MLNRTNQCRVYNVGGAICGKDIVNVIAVMYSAESCSDIDKHPEEKKTYLTAHYTIKETDKELQKLMSDLDSKARAMNTVHHTFSSRMFSRC